MFDQTVNLCFKFDFAITRVKINDRISQHNWNIFHIKYRTSYRVTFQLCTLHHRTPVSPLLTLIKLVVCIYIAIEFDQDPKRKHKRKTRVTETSCSRNETDVIRALRAARNDTKSQTSRVFRCVRSIPR